MFSIHTKLLLALKKGLNGQDYSYSVSHHQVKKIPPSIMLFGKLCYIYICYHQNNVPSRLLPVITIPVIINICWYSHLHIFITDLICDITWYNIPPDHNSEHNQLYLIKRSARGRVSLELEFYFFLGLY